MPSENEYYYQLSPEERAVIEAMAQRVAAAKQELQAAQDKITGALEYLHVLRGHKWEWVYTGDGKMTKKTA